MYNDIKQGTVPMICQTVSVRPKKSRWDKFLDWLDNLKIQIQNFFDFKYRKQRRNKVLKAGELDRVPVAKAVFKDEKA